MTVHAAKGKEFGSVLFVLDDARDRRTDDLLDAWEGRVTSEGRRVAYVAVTRARRVVGIAVPARYSDRVRALLERDGVPFERVQVPADAPTRRARRPRGQAG